jgi:hypothetical protein
LALIVYGELHRRWLPGAVATTVGDGGTTFVARALRGVSVWMRETFPRADPARSPDEAQHRDVITMRGYWRGIGELIAPRTLSLGAADAPIHKRTVLLEATAGDVLGVAFPLTALLLWIRTMTLGATRKEEDPTAEPSRMPLERVLGLVVLGLVAIAVVLDRFVLGPSGKLASFHALAWWVRALIVAAPIVIGVGLVTEGDSSTPPDEAPREGALPLIACVGLVAMAAGYFLPLFIEPMSPGMGAERLFYLPALGVALLLGAIFAALSERAARRGMQSLFTLFVVAFLAVQCVQAFRLSRRALPGDSGPVPTSVASK